jgi:hypothetical protein
MVIAHIAIGRATRSRRAANSHHSQAHQAHCRITSFAFHFEAGSLECEVFASSTYRSSTCGAPFHSRASSDTSYATKVHLAVVYSGGLCHTSYNGAVLPDSRPSDEISTSYSAFQVVIEGLITMLGFGLWPGHTGASLSQSAKVYNYSITFQQISGLYEVISAAQGSRFSLLTDVTGDEPLCVGLRKSGEVASRKAVGRKATTVRVQI